MSTELVHIGFGNFVAVNRLIAIVSPGSPRSEPIKRLVDEAKKHEGLFIDATRGRRTKAVLVMDGGQIVLAAVEPRTIAGRLAAKRGLGGVGPLEEESE
ncbi:MAG: DUF370 domain-containing protein [Chloroflexi bacterium]|nr:DUF370 domain-containing protein [Chloroflexota bacterium]